MRWVVGIAAFAGLCFSVAPAAGQSCAVEPYCTRMRSCAEADFYFRQCGHYKRDGDNDGIPCEDLCGKTMKSYLERRNDDPAFASRITR
jgi:hypothetical protein